ncbi:MBL fold metallo-hydrolase [Streptomyces sp. NPDC050564]|uniref:MBL fold metallo-hydrolase n=1 Tax=Streptomyces sp. NPDC050564 TaxID=3365631 RepID=UPI00379E634F
MTASAPSSLAYETFVSDGTPRAGEERLPNGDRLVSSPLTSTLIFGEEDAVLVDPPFTREQTEQVGNWVERSGRRLTHVYSTHGHGDHWFGTAELVKRFRGSPSTRPAAPSRSCTSRPPTGVNRCGTSAFPA